VTKTVNLGDTLFANIEDNLYLKELYENILYNYSLCLIKSEAVTPRDVNILDALRFADLLSKSVNVKISDSHRTMAQEIVAILDKLYPDNEIVKYYMGSILFNAGNYRGLDLRSPNYVSASILDRFYVEFNKELVSIPAEPDKQFFRAQKTVYEHLTDEFFSYSGPTSMGKSFIMRMFIKEKVIAGENLNFCLLVPTKALINEVNSRVINDLKELLSEHNYQVVTSAGALGLKQKHNFVLVLTPERLLYLLLADPDFRLDYLFIDEAHKISSKDSRSAFYYKLVDMLSRRVRKPHIVFSSPNIPNPEVYLQLLPNIQETTKYKLVSSYTPVSQIKYLVDLLDKKVKLYNNQTRELVEITTVDSEITLSDFVLRVGRDSKNIVYCNSTSKAVNYAVEYASHFPNPFNKELMDLSKEIKSEIHGDYFLADLILKGIAYHVGYLPASIRLRIEELYKSNDIHTVFCTSTLIEGVNLPADNLFITSNKNGLANMGAVDFRNLIGRVGRIEYNLYGNVFLVRPDDKVVVEKYTELLSKEVPEQRLSVISELTKTQKQKIIESLRAGNIELLKHPSNQSADSYALMRKFAIILLRDIVAGNDSAVKKAFGDFLDASIEADVKKKFSNANPDDDINVSVDQTSNLTQAIAKGLTYPCLKPDGSVDYNSLIAFLEILAGIFKWDKYESATLGQRNKNTRQYNYLRWYTVILAQWIAGDGLSYIIAKALEYKHNNPLTQVRIDYNKYEDYNDSPTHKNIVITDTLEAIEHIILFSISNYFLRFSQEYKRFHNLKEFNNDWYEFVEYGTTNPLTITLQRNGISRETATYIKSRKADYIALLANGDIKIKNAVLSCQSQSVRREITEIKYNIPGLFVD